MKKNNFTPPSEIVVNGEVVKFHYNREERLKNAPNKTDPDDKRFFSKKFRHIHILLADIIIIAIIGFVFTYFYGRSQSVTYDNFRYHMSRKGYSDNTIASFTLQIKNESTHNNALPGNYFPFTLVNSAGKTVYKKDLFITKLTYNPNEYYIEEVVANSLPPDTYTATLGITDTIKLTLKFGTKRWNK